MKPVKALLSICLLSSQNLLAENVEERAWPVTSLLTPSPFQLNAAAIPTNLTIISGLRLSRNEESTYFINPKRSTPAFINHTTQKKDIALGLQVPMGGGVAFGLSGDEHSRQISGESDQRNSDVFEEFWVRDYKMKFVVDLLPQLRGGFTFRYQSHQADLLGGYGVSNDDRTRYKGTMSGYSVGANYRIQSVSIGVFTAPPLRGKVMIEGEQKIITDPGVGGLELGWTYSDRLSLGITALKWSYKHDERDDDATSPEDQRNIFLRGVDIDQYYRKTIAVGVGAEFAILPVAGVKGSFVQQRGVYLFDAAHVPGDNPDLETNIPHNELRLGGFIRNKQFFAELVLLKASREKSVVRVGRNGIEEIGTYEHDISSNVVTIGAVF